MRILSVGILLFALYFNLNASNNKERSYFSSHDSSQVKSESQDKRSYKRSTMDKFIFDFQLNASYITNKYEYLEIQFNLVPNFYKNIIFQIGTTFGTYESDKISVNDQNISHTVYSYSFGIGGLIHYKSHEFILLFNYAEKDYIIEQGSSSKFNRSADYVTIYDNLGSRRIRFLAGIRYYIKNMPLKGDEQRWTAIIGLGLNLL